jgi:hypothetical protein
MDLWLTTELRVRRDVALDNARRHRIANLAASGRSTRLRVAVAQSAQLLSDVLAALARSLRNGESA